MVLANFIAAEELIIEILDEIYLGKRVRPSLKVLIQPMELCEGGLSQVEEAAFNDLAEHIGGKYVFIHPNQEKIDDIRIRELTR